MEKTKIMEVNMKKLDIAMKKGEELLSQMIPAAVSEKLKAGATPAETCEVFEQVTIVFNMIHEFMDICTKCDGLQIVEMLNTMFGMFDVLTERNAIYKVETVKDSFVGVSGAPDKNKNHAEKIMDMALDMRDVVTFIKDPRPENADGDGHVKIFLGSHSGPVVAGIVGNKAPRYCLFGDAMNTSSRMMSFGDAQCIHISKYEQLCSYQNFLHMIKHACFANKSISKEQKIGVQIGQFLSYCQSDGETLLCQLKKKLSGFI